MDTFFGIPAHPLMVHLPAVLLPLGFLGAVVMLIKKAWYERYKWAVLVVTGLGAVGAILAASSGESLEGTLEAGERSSIEAHAEAGETARLFGIIFFVVVLAWVLVPILLKRRAAAPASSGADAAVAPAQPTWLRPVFAALVLISGGASLVTVIDAGHSGAKKVWVEESGQEGGDGD